MKRARLAKYKRIRTGRLGIGGFGGIVEILVTIVIISFAIFAFIVLLRSSHKEMAISREFVAASAEAGRLLQAMKSVPYEKFPVTGGMVDAGRMPFLEKAGGAPAGLDELTEMISIEERSGVKVIDLEISWRAKGKEANAQSSRIEFTVFKTPF